MGIWNADGSWTSNSGKTYGPNDVISPADNAEWEADSDTKNGTGPGDDPSLAGAIRGGNNALAGARIAPNAPGAQLNTTEADAQRGGVGDLIAQLEQQAATGDGAWRDTFMQGVQRAKATAQAVGQSNPMTDYGSALTNIGNVQAGVGQRAVGQENILRAQSQQDAQDQLAQLYSGQGAQDIDQATAEANARRGVRGANLTLKKAAQQTTTSTLSGAGQAAGAAAGMSDGGAVPGEARFPGDDERNDTVHAKVEGGGDIMVSPGEVVLPRSIAHDPQAAADFVRALNASKARSGGTQHLADGGDVWNDPAYQAERKHAWAPGMSDPTGPRPGSVDIFGASGDIQAPSIENGGVLDTKNFEQTRAGGNRFAARLRERAAGGGPSVAGQQMTNATDAAIAQSTQSGAPAAAQTAGAAGAAEMGGAEAALTKAKEQSAGQNALGHRLSTARGQELALADAQQQAAWQNTMTNLGIGLEQQAAMRNLFSGAGQAATSFAGAGGGKGGSGYQTDPSSLSTLSDQPFDAGSSPDEWSPPDGEQGSGLKNGYADGGIVARAPTGEKLETDREFFARRAAEQAAREDADRVYEDEEGEHTSKTREAVNHATATLQRAVPHSKSGLARFGDYVKKAAGSVAGMAEGGDIDASGVPPSDVSALFYTPGPGVDAGTPALVPASYQPAAAPSPKKGGLLPEGSGIERAFRAPPGHSSLLGTGFSAPTVAARQEADEAAKPFPNGIKAPDAAPPKTDEAPPAPAAKPIAGGVALPPSHALEEGFASNEAQLAAQAQTDAEVSRARAEVEGLKAKEMAMQSAQLDMKAAHDRARQQTAEAMTRWNAAQDEFNRIDTTVDPGRFWASRTTGQKVLGIIGLALGAAGTGPDGVNKAAQLLNQAIDRDLQAQKDQHELRLKKGAQKLGAAQTYYAMAREAGHDDIAATELAKAAALDGAALKAEQLVASTNEPIAKAKGQALAAALRGGAIDKTKAGEQQTFENRVKNQTLNIQAAAVGAKGGLGEGERKELHDNSAAAADALGLIGSIRGGLAHTQSAIPGKTAINQNVGTDAAKLQTDVSALTTKLGVIEKLGALSDDDRKVLRETIGDPQAVFTREATKKAKLDQLEGIIRRSVQNQRAAAGVR